MESLILIPALEYVAVISVMEKKILEPRLFTSNVIKIFASTSLCFSNNTEWLDLRTSQGKVASASLTILQAELDCVQKELRELKEQ